MVRSAPVGHFTRKQVTTFYYHYQRNAEEKPYFLLYNRDPVLPINNILKPKRKYSDEEDHKITLQEQHKLVVLVHKHLKRAKKPHAKYANKNAMRQNLK